MIRVELSGYPLHTNSKCANAMEFAVTPTHERGRRLSDAEIEAAAPVIGDLMTYQCPREPGGPMRTMAGVSSPVNANLVRPIIEPRMYSIGFRALYIRGLEEIKTERGWVYVLQEWIVEPRPYSSDKIT